MYSYIRGTLEEVREDFIVVENHGIGYNIRVPLGMLEGLPDRGGQIKVYTSLHVREDALSLFGFPSRDELEMFQLLINVSGVGPKAALAVLSVLSPADIRLAVVSGDVKVISKAPGVGKKTAQRLIMELKDKVDQNDIIGTAPEAPESAVCGNQIVKKEAAQALAALGYSAAEAGRVLSGIEIPEDADVESVLKLALKNMAFM